MNGDELARRGEIQLLHGRTQYAYEQVFKSEWGRIVLWDLSRYTGYGREEPFVAGEPDRTAHNLGQHHVVRRILHMISMDPEELKQIVDRQSAALRQHDPMREQMQ